MIGYDKHSKFIIKLYKDKGHESLYYSYIYDHGLFEVSFNNFDLSLQRFWQDDVFEFPRLQDYNCSILTTKT